MSVLKSPLWYVGGKTKHIKFILPLVPHHHTYVEVFGGGASLLLAKQQSPVEVYNDIYSDVVNFFRVLRDQEKFDELYRELTFVPYSREEYVYFRDNFNADTDVKKAIKFFILSRMSFAGYTQGSTPSWGLSIIRNPSIAFSNVVDGLPLICHRLRKTLIENQSWEYILRKYDTENTFFYLDPPYVPDTRGLGGYFNEMTHEDHERLIESLLNIKGKVLLSGYNNDIYKKLIDNGWKYQEHETVCDCYARVEHLNSKGKGFIKDNETRVESLWYNYDASKTQNLEVIENIL